MHTSAPELVRPLLSVKGLAAGYGSLRVIENLDMSLGQGEIVALVGPNGAGKSTLLKAISSLILKTGGTVTFDGDDITRLSPRECGKRGLVHVLEGHRVFAPLTVEENLLLAAFDVPAARRLALVEEAYAFFPDIAKKRHDKAGALSGGQQQMLAVGQGIVRRPKLLILDEPSAGLAPVLIDRVLEVVESLRAKGAAILLVEQAVEKALRVADRVYVMVHGKLVLNTDAASARAPGVLEAAYLGTSTNQ
ncbi:MAG TPA: ABC transporter ATP-binding protein [Polaromonas sp.]|uniref:ABC transporter ATP-binding protein n=1 Tax=Polaromonas sp. UBA4122 TaxID=1947074 RepID=UPI000ED6B53A|nr:ABC transporter ATP-binding protein [Polaromonas sp. UBA4122]HAL38141.1 ABC transporter ATP-binding protein [Polaromonas sp.]